MDPSLQSGESPLVVRVSSWNAQTLSINGHSKPGRDLAYDDISADLMFLQGQRADRCRSYFRQSDRLNLGNTPMC